MLRARVTRADTCLGIAQLDLQTVRGQLDAAQAATGVVLPPGSDVDGRPGVSLPDGPIEAVTSEDGVVVIGLLTCIPVLRLIEP